MTTTNDSRAAVPPPRKVEYFTKGQFKFARNGRCRRVNVTRPPLRKLVKRVNNEDRRPHGGSSSRSSTQSSETKENNTKLFNGDVVVDGNNNCTENEEFLRTLQFICDSLETKFYELDREKKINLIFDRLEQRKIRFVKLMEDSERLETLERPRDIMEQCLKNLETTNYKKRPLPKVPDPTNRKKSKRGPKISMDDVGPFIDYPHEHDVLCGRGNGLATWPGNVYFRQVVWDFKDQYNDVNKRYKQNVAEKVAQVIAARDPPGRFLEKTEDGPWTEISHHQIMLKVCQALREQRNKWPSLTTTSPEEKSAKKTLSAMSQQAAKASANLRQSKSNNSSEKKMKAQNEKNSFGPRVVPLNEIHIGTRISIYWPLDHAYYPASVQSRLGSKFFVTYDDQESEWLDLTEHQFKIITDTSGSLPTNVVMIATDESGHLRENSESGSSYEGDDDIMSKDSGERSGVENDVKRTGPWTKREIELYHQGISRYGNKFGALAKHIGTRDRQQVRFFHKSSIKSAEIQVRSLDFDYESTVCVSPAHKFLSKPSNYPPEALFPQENDVLMGRGNGYATFPGNINYRKVVWRFREEYSQIERLKKVEIAAKIIDVIASQSPPGRFLTWNASGRWVEVDKKRVLEKTCQALRELKWSPQAKY